MKMKYTIECAECGHIFQASGSRIRCPICGTVETILDPNDPLPERTADPDNPLCKNCTVPMFICEMCTWACKEGEHKECNHTPQQPVAAEAKKQETVMKTVKKEAPEGLLSVEVRWIGTLLQHPNRAYKYVMKGVSEFQDRIFHDSEGVNGTFLLPRDQWDEKSELYDVECDDCGQLYPALGQKGTEMECPFCGRKEVV